MLMRCRSRTHREASAAVAFLAYDDLDQRDRILQINGVSVESLGDFCEILWEGMVGDPVELIVRREEETLHVTVQAEDRRGFYLSPLQEARP
jgi:S1-C subfamily serine protease